MSLSLDKIREAFPDSPLEFHNIPYGSQAWLDFRAKFLGGSEIGIISGINPYASGIKLYYTKLGLTPPDPDREHMWHGRMLEPYIKMCWKHWDGIPANYMVNFAEKKPMRDCFKWDGYIVNPKYPWLVVSPDSFIDMNGLNGGMDMVNFQPLPKHGILELKLLSYWGEHAWEDGFPQYYILQIQTYLLVCELDYAEVCIFHEGNRIEVHPFYANKTIQDRILSISKRWYDNHLKPGFEAKEAYDLSVRVGNKSETLKYDGMLQHLEPPPDTSEHYKQFQSDIFRRERDTIIAPPGTEKNVLRAQLLQKVISRLEKSKTHLRNKIINVHSLAGAEELTYESGYTRFYKKKGAKNHTLDIRIQGYPSEERVKQETSKIDLNE